MADDDIVYMQVFRGTRKQVKKHKIEREHDNVAEAARDLLNNGGNT